jgi:urate oxidase
MSDNFQSLGDALNQFTGQKRMKNSIHEIRIVTFWVDLMGDLVNKYTEKIYLNKTTLFIKVGPDSLKNELHYSKETIIQKINEHFKNEIVTKIVLL